MGCFNADIGFVDREDEINPFRDQGVRKRFIKRVYLILSVQLLVVIGFVCLFVYSKEVFFWVKEQRYVIFIVLFLFICTTVLLMFSNFLRHTSPYNIILFCMFTVFGGFSTGFGAGFYAPKEVLTALAITAAVCFAITIFAMQAKCDFTICYVFMLVVTIILFAFSILTWFFFRDRVLRMVIAAIGVTVFSIWLLIDTQLIMGGRTHELDPDEYLLGAMFLFLDIILIFQYILELVGSS